MSRWRRLRRASFLFATVSLVAIMGCQEDVTAPTPPEPAPVLATAATQALAFYQVSAGGLFTCGVTTDNRAYCWGYNSVGQLGDGTTTDHLTPAAVVGGLRFRQISAGSSTCGVTTEYRAYCWGNNVYGQLGDGTTTSRLTPVPVAGGLQFRQVETNWYQTCGVTYLDNRAYCWGNNGVGQLGDGTTTDHLTPVRVAGTLRFRQVTMGRDHTCGVTTSDKAFCWGSNFFGQVGDSTEVGRRLTPARVAGGRQFRQVDAGNDHTCAVTTNDLAFCWGEGRDGQVGNGKAYLSFWPKRVAGGLYFERVGAGRFHSCGETTSNRAYCWGNNSVGQLGDGTTTRRLTPVPVAGGLSFVQLSVGFMHTCGKTPAAIAYCWGYNGYGAVGDGTTTTRYKPVRVAGP